MLTYILLVVIGRWAGQDAMPPVPAGSRYVAMGSSFAAGPGIAPRAPSSPRRAGRSSGNYAHLVARALGLDLQDVTYSGATTSDILQPSAAGQPAQLEAVTPDTRLVTITAGGNDVGFLPRLTLARRSSTASSQSSSSKAPNSVATI